MVECAEKYEEWIVDELAGELDEERRAELEQHLEQCAGCRGLLRESRRVVELYRQLPGEEPASAIDRLIREQAFADEEVQPGAVARIAPGPGPARGKWLALAASVIFALGAGVGYGVFHLRAKAEQERLEIEQAVETARVKQEAEEVYEEAAAAAAAAARVAEEAAAEAKRLEGTLEEKEALARAKKLAAEAEQAKAAAKGAAGKADRATGAGKKKATGKAGGKKKKGLGDDPLGADYEL